MSVLSLGQTRSSNTVHNLIRSPSPQKRQKSTVTTTSSPTDNKEIPTQAPLAPKPNADHLAPPASPHNPRKRRASHSPKLNTLPPGITPAGDQGSGTILGSLTDEAGRKRGRTNTPWTAQEEQRLKQMRDSGHSWSEIAKAFPARTEGSVKKHWYKASEHEKQPCSPRSHHIQDMHYAEFAEDESAALREAIKEYEANKWKAIGAKLGKPAKACEQYAKEHFKNG
ncbi:uncharacterized protein A1O9_06714 [Exophiala aquamarina CBS 119918]|uniref:Myb-like domain-containing protein n=1 Tax=Exophiala aquamarina CBS 119918 TaxID=1182545 RepID=A0A072P9T2_9EURO|nr:uncharacterized protein A1O9_06714 [Exophiala aquamarina CBS 119918]KEF56527.1 hypothetical protein A1O9_06714 [Exophiala aquamarina CBS 119918]